MAGNFLSNYLGSLKFLPNNAGKLDFGISATLIPFVKLTSLGGTAYYIFVTNDGRMRVNTSEPATNTDGTTITVTQVDATALIPVGTHYRDGSGNEFIYMQGVASLDATHNWVTFDSAYVTTLLAAGAKGAVAVAMSLLNSSTTTFGWYQIWGKNTIAGTDAVATGAVVYIDASAGRVDDSAVTGDLVLGAVTNSTDASTNVATVSLNYPQVTSKIG